jgi:phospholipid N-methyltransferase
LVPRNARIAEVGVGLGIFSEKILNTCKPEKFYALDLYDLHRLEILWGKPTRETFGNLTHREFFEAKFQKAIQDGVMEVMENDSLVSLGSMEDHSLDMVYVDAHHTYEAVLAELNVIRHKIKANGIIILNDYTYLENVGSKDEYGVIQAAHEFMMSEGWEMRYLALQEYMFCDVLITKVLPDGDSIPLRSA